MDFTPKILVLSVSSWNSKTGSDTWPSLVSQFGPDNVASIALRENIPDSSASNHYFIISENKIIQSVLHRRIKTGYEVCINDFEAHNNDLKEHLNRYQKASNRKFYHIKLMIRELVWILGKWKSDELNQFVDSFNPDVVLYSMDGYPHFNRLCNYVISRTNAKSIGFFVDDNFTYKQQKGIGFKIYRFIQRLSLKKLAKVTDRFWAISPLTKKEADETFQIDCKIVTKPAKERSLNNDNFMHNPKQILYAGNLNIGRNNSLLKFVKALKLVNKSNIDFELDVYTQTKLSDESLKELRVPFCRIHSPIPQTAIFKLQQKSDILLFLEDIDGPNAQIARLSFSTKITDYLSTGKCIIALGNTQTSPIQYFLSNNCALVATTVDEIINIFNRIKMNPSVLSEYGESARECAIKYHNKDKILSIVKDDIYSLIATSFNYHPYSNK